MANLIYTLIADVSGTTTYGEPVQFSVERDVFASVADTSLTYESATNVALDENSSGTPDPVRAMLQGAIESDCLRYGIAYESIVIDAYHVRTDDLYTLVYFHPEDPSETTTDGSAQPYAHLADAHQVPPAFTELESLITDTTIGLSWLPNPRAERIEIFKGDTLAADLDGDAAEWLDDSLAPGSLHTYRLRAVNAYGPGPESVLTLRTNITDPPLAPGSASLSSSPHAAPEAPSERLPAFQSGIGDGLDLLVRTNKEATAQETFTYTAQIKAYSEETVRVYPEREFQYRFVARDAEGHIVAETPYRIGLVNGEAPLTFEGAGKRDLVTPLEIDIPEGEGITVEVDMKGPDYMRAKFTRSTGSATPFPDDQVTFYTLVAARENRLVRTAHYGAKTTGTQALTVRGEAKLEINDEVANPAFDAALKDLTLTDWQIVLTSSNPNAGLRMLREPEVYGGDLQRLRFRAEAFVKNQSQTPWNPLIHSGYYYFNQDEHYLYSETRVTPAPGRTFDIDLNGELRLRPAPQQGAPVIVSDASGPLTRVSFYDEEGNPTLVCMDAPEVRGRDALLSHPDPDPATLVVESLQGTNWAPVGYTLNGHALRLEDAYAGEPVRARYKIKNSFYLDQNWNPEDDEVKLAVHSDAMYRGETSIHVTYETNKRSAYHLADGLNLNPMVSVQSEGYLYVTDQTEPPASIDVQAHPRVLFASGYDATVIRAVIKDRYDNPVSGEQAVITVSRGTARVLQGVTDQNGMVLFSYQAPKEAGPVDILVEASGIQAAETLLVKAEAIAPRLTLSLSQPTIRRRIDTVQVTAFLYGENQQALAGVPIMFAASTGELDEQQVVTNHFGEASVLLRTNQTPLIGAIYVSADVPEIGLTETAVVRTETFVDWNANAFAAANNLIDVYDAADAREKLGFTAGSKAPVNPEAHDLWVDQGDIFWLQEQYNLSDVLDKEAARESLHIYTGAAPEAPTDYTIVIETEEE